MKNLHLLSCHFAPLSTKELLWMFWVSIEISGLSDIESMVAVVDLLTWGCDVFWDKHVVSRGKRHFISIYASMA